MITELIGFLIIAGAVLYVFLRWNMAKTKKEPADLKNASEDLCKQLEIAGDQIIDRVESYVDRLEALIEKADDRIRILDQKILRLEQIEQATSPTENHPKQQVEEVLPDFAEALSKAEEKAKQLSDEVPQWNDSLRPMDGQQEDPVVMQERLPKVISPRNKRVFLLMEQGVSEDDISKETGISKGGLTLIREMYKASKGLS